MKLGITGIDNSIFLKEDINKDSKLNRNNQFGSLLNDALSKVNELQLVSDEYKKLLVTGDIDNLHDITIAQEKANISLQLTLGVRNKVVEAYREIMRMQI